MKQRVVVVGNGMVGQKLVDNIVADDTGEVELVVIAGESRLAYDRVHLSGYFVDKTSEDLALTDEGFYEDNQIKYSLNDKVAAIDLAERLVTTTSGRKERYDKLVLATGSYPFVPPVPGHEREHCHVYRTIDDLDAIMASADCSEVGVVVGGGLLGLEAANALKNLDLKTHIVEFAPQLMGVQLDANGSALLQSKIESLGLEVHTGKNTEKITDGAERRYRMEFTDGSFLETDVIVFSAGIRPEDSLARETGLALGERGGIVINDQCLTSDPDVFAIGECALWQGKIYGLVAPGYQMAKVVTSHLQGTDPVDFKGADMSTKLKLLGVDVASIGDAHGETEGCKSFVYQDDVNQVYKRLVVSENGKKLIGAVLVGDAQAYGTLLQLKLNGIKLPNRPENLILPATGETNQIGVESLPESAQICSCYDVSKAQICASVDSGCRTPGDVKADTKASSGCGGCAMLLKQVVDHKLVQLGIEVNNHVCEHFEFSRQELADIVRVKQIRTFKELIQAHGRGLGCDVCKPTVGSILASYWNEHVLKEDHVTLQDTNDVFLANMQKDGTYSVIPRVPGGEITPARLIAIGEIASEFELYTKITGAQRIDLLGAQVHELPIIWKRLIDAGFETGHAYGKALRTVKSCVGSSWCRYGVQDSVTTAIYIEERYRGLRSPHKLKMAVSGCTRECAEAQSKDVGVIATEKGWNLYVCGNGGMRPRHADLFAVDIDTPTMIRYIDRFLMFYVRTADRLQRTSVWLENLDGGLEYLKDVIIHDKLGIGDELESDMANVIGTYQCEWKVTIEDPEKLKRFRHFINADEPDSNLAFVTERGQKRPATKDERIELKEVAS